MQKNPLFETYFFDRTFVAAPQSIWPSFTQKSASTEDHVVWFVQQHPSLQLRFRVLGPPVMIATCAWLAHHLQNTTGPWAWATLQKQCMSELEVPYTQHPLVAFAMAPLQRGLTTQ